MNIISIYKKFPTQEHCIKHLEQIKWGNKPVCPTCNSSSVTSFKKELRHHCNECNSSFSVLKDTIFEGTRLELQKWFYAISLMLNAKKGLSSLQLSRDLNVAYNTAWYLQMRIRCAMASDGYMLQGIIQMDETYAGGKPRKSNFVGTVSANPRGRGTSKVPIVGIVEDRKGGKVKAEVVETVTTKTLMKLLKENVNLDNSVLMTDKFKAYDKMGEIIKHHSVDHALYFSKNGINTNTIESFWAIIKRSLHGQYHSVSKKYLPFYLAEMVYRYNNRLNDTKFSDTVKRAVKEDKCFVDMKPKQKSKLPSSK